MLFTPENAALYGHKGGLMSVRAKSEAERKRLERLAEAAHTTGYVDKTLIRVRLQLDQIFDLFTNEEDPQKLDRLAAAQARLAEQERVLAERPLPGSRRPGKERGRAVEELGEPEPLPIPPAAVPPVPPQATYIGPETG